MGTMRERQRDVQLYRGQVPSPGRPTVAWREDRVRVWAAVARGGKAHGAAGEAGGGVARGSGQVLGSDRARGEDRGRSGGGGCVIPRCVPVVSSRWRRE